MLALFLSVWVTVLNPDGIYNGHVFLRFEDRCELHPPYTVDTLAPLNDRQGLYRYRRSVAIFGVACPNGTLFAMEPLLLKNLQRDVERQDAERTERAQRFKQHLDQRGRITPCPLTPLTLRCVRTPGQVALVVGFWTTPEADPCERALDLVYDIQQLIAPQGRTLTLPVWEGGAAW